MLQRRLMISGFVAAPAIIRLSSMMPISILASRVLAPRMAPAIVPASSLMPVSPIAEIVRYVVRVRHVQGGQTTILGEAPIDGWGDLSSIVQQITAGRLAWGESLHVGVGGTVEVHVLRHQESALSFINDPSGKYTGRSTPDERHV